MATISELISGIEVELEACQKRQQKSKAEIKLILDEAAQEGRAALSEQENDRTKELFGAIDLAKAQEKGIRSKLETARKALAEEEEMERSAQTTREHAPKRDTEQRKGEFYVTAEERTYSPKNDPAGRQFLMDVCRQHMFNDVGAASRLSKHMHEERIERGQWLERADFNTTTTNWAGLTVPQYITDMVAPAVASLRPLADNANKHPLPPDGMSLNISRVTTASAAGLQPTGELNELTGQSIDDTLLTIPVLTAGGTQIISRQAVERGTGIEDVVMQDLFSRYHTNLDSQMINQATTGLSAAATAVTYDDTTPTAAEMYPKILGAEAGAEAALLAMARPDIVVMHSRRWAWLSSQMTSTWPFINTPGVPVQAGGIATSAGYNQGARGTLPNGLAVIVDNNVPTNLGVGTNQDEVYVVSSREAHLWESPGQPAFIRAEQPRAQALGVMLVVYGYFAYTFSRYTNGMQKVAGTGLVTPAF